MLVIFCNENVCYIVVGFVVFKQKTAYEMRISDWSSDVCSSDLVRSRSRLRKSLAPDGIASEDPRQVEGLLFRRPARNEGRPGVAETDEAGPGPRCARPGIFLVPDELFDQRSEEHTSELQSLMRTSYAVFCLKKNKINTQCVS